MKKYVPRRGDVVWLTFDPQLSSEQAGRRPALVLSHHYYNVRSGLVICCPITSKVKNYPFEVLIPAGLKVKGAVLSDHIKSLDWAAREAEFICQMPSPTVEDILGSVSSIVESELT